MKPISSLSLAKQGDHHAISTILNKYLRVKGFEVDSTKRQRCLWLTIEAEEVPPQTNVVAFIESCLKKIQPIDIERVVIKGRAVGRRTAWQERLLLNPNHQSQPVKKLIYRRRPSAIRDGGSGILMGLIMAIATVGLWQTWQSQKQPWEYRLERVDALLLETTLESLGAQGWELSTAPRIIEVGDTTNNIYEVIFKRPSTSISTATPRESNRLTDGSIIESESSNPTSNTASSTPEISQRLSPNTGYYPLPQTPSQPTSNHSQSDKPLTIEYHTLNDQGEPVTRFGKLQRTPHPPIDQASHNTAPVVSPLYPPPLPVPNIPIP